jgi:hypothetical protein
MKTLSLPRQHDWILPSLALLSFLVGGIFFKIDQRLPETVWDGRDLISGLEPKELSKITFKTNSQSFSLNRQSDGFTIDSQNDAPVDMNKLNEVLLRLGGAQISHVIGDKDDWEKYRVDKKNAEMIIGLYTRENTPKWKVYLGENIIGKSGRAVRLEGRNEIFVTSNPLYLRTSSSDYISKEAFRIPKSKVTNIEIYQGGERLDEKRFIKDDLLASIDPLGVVAHYRTGALPADLQGISWNWQAQILSDNGIIYNIFWGKKDEKWLAKAVASSNQSLDANAPLIDLKILALKSEVDKFNQQKMPWIWELSTESTEKLTRGLMYGEKKKSDKIFKK